jgi:hypothetical protein
MSQAEIPPTHQENHSVGSILPTLFPFNFINHKNSTIMNVTLKPGEKWFEQFIVPSKETNDVDAPKEYYQSAPCPPIPAEFESVMAYLRHLTQEGFRQRLGASPSMAATERMNKELALIEQKGWQNYFLFIWDLVKSAEETLPSCFVHVAYEAPSCLVNYLLHITEVDVLCGGIGVVQPQPCRSLVVITILDELLRSGIDAEESDGRLANAE